MKKIYVLFIALMIVALVLSCGSTSSAAATAASVPEWLNELPPSDEFWGKGSAKLQNESLAMDSALAQARRDVGAQVQVLVQSVLRRYENESGTLNDAASIQSHERVIREVVDINLSGAVPVKQTRMPDGTWWVRVAIKKSAAQGAVNDVFATEASRYANFKADEAIRMMQEVINETQSRP